jgi:hypothetical protein
VAGQFLAFASRIPARQYATAFTDDMDQPHAVAGALGQKANLVATNGAQFFTEGTAGVALPVDTFHHQLTAIGTNDAAFYQARR